METENGKDTSPEEVLAAKVFKRVIRDFSKDTFLEEVLVAKVFKRVIRDFSIVGSIIIAVFALLGIKTILDFNNFERNLGIAEGKLETMTESLQGKIAGVTDSLQVKIDVELNEQRARFRAFKIPFFKPI